MEASSHLGAGRGVQEGCRLWPMARKLQALLNFDVSVKEVFVLAAKIKLLNMLKPPSPNTTPQKNCFFSKAI